MAETFHFRILGIHLSTYGLSYSVLERTRGLVAYGVTRIRKNGNSACRDVFEKLLARYRPDLLVLPDMNPAVKSSARKKKLSASFVRLAKAQGIEVKLLSKSLTYEHLLAVPDGTKHEVATVFAKKFPGELARLLPPPRTTADNEDYRMGIFEATALAVTAMAKRRQKALVSNKDEPSILSANHSDNGNIR